MIYFDDRFLITLHKRYLLTNTYLIFRYKIQNACRITEKLQASWKPDVVSVVHWDGKLMMTLDGGRTEERLPVLLSGENGTKLLGVPALPQLQEGDAVGRLIAEATVGLLQEWNCSESVRGMCFDTTASNTGMGE